MALLYKAEQARTALSPLDFSAWLVFGAEQSVIIAPRMLTRTVRLVRWLRNMMVSSLLIRPARPPSGHHSLLEHRPPARETALHRPRRQVQDPRNLFHRKAAPIKHPQHPTEGEGHAVHGGGQALRGFLDGELLARARRMERRELERSLLFHRALFLPVGAQ